MGISYSKWKAVKTLSIAITEIGFITSFIFIPLKSYSIPDSCSRLWKSQSVINKIRLSSPETKDALPEIDSFLEKTYAVHATALFPTEGIIKAGHSDLGEFAEIFVHFAIGNLVPSHRSGEWFTKPIAILVPLKEVMPSAVNFFAQDTAVLGDFQLPKNTIVLVQKGIQIEGKQFQFQVKEFEGSLTEAIAREQFFQRKNIVQMRENSGFPGDPAFFNEYNINSKEFFQVMKSKFPHIKEGNAMENVIHKTDFLFTMLKDKELNISDNEYQLIKNTISRRISLIKAEIRKFPLSALQQNQLKQKIAFYQEIIKKIAPQSLDNSKAKLQFELELAFLNSDLKIMEFLNFIKNNSSIENSSLYRLSLKYIAYRLQKPEVNNAEVSALLSLYNEIFKKLPAEEQKEVAHNIYRYPIYEYLNSSIHDAVIVKRFEELVQEPLMKQHLADFFERGAVPSFFEIGQSYNKQQSLDEFVSFYTTKIYKEMDSNFKLRNFDLVRNLIFNLENVVKELGFIKTLHEFLPSIANDLIQQSRKFGILAKKANSSYTNLIEDATTRYEQILNNIISQQVQKTPSELILLTGNGHTIKVFVKENIVIITDPDGPIRELDFLKALGFIFTQ